MSTDAPLWSYAIVSYEESPAPRDLLWSHPTRAFSSLNRCVAAAISDVEGMAEEFEATVDTGALFWDHSPDGSRVAIVEALGHWVRVFPMGLD